MSRDFIGQAIVVHMNRLKGDTGFPFQWLLPLLFFFIGLIYVYAVPHFEAPDNIPHVGMIKWIAEQRELPVQSADHEHLYGQEASQPPLYYLLMAPIWSVFDTSDFDDLFRPNPLAVVGHPSRLGNRNRVFYRQPYPPNLSGTSLALYIVRLATLGMATVTVAAVYQAARTILPQKTGFAVLATALAAFNSQFLFISASISNDNLVTMFAALICWQALLMLRDGFQTRRSLLLALLIALASLAKLGGLVLGVAVVLAGLWLFIRTRNLRGFIYLVAAIIVIWLLIAGWWFLRNLMLYDELFGTATMLDFYGRRIITLQRLLLKEFEGFRISFWGLFGSFTILTHKVHYFVMDVLSAISAVGLIVFLAINRRNRAMMAFVLFLSVLLAMGSAALIWWTQQTTASTGRLIFPYITSISLLMAMGLNALRIPPLLVWLPMLCFSLVAPFVYIKPNYDHPPQVENLPDSAVSTYLRWQDITLIGYEIPPQQRWSPGDEIPITLYWQPLAQSTESHALFISLLDSSGNALATLDAFPGWGTLPTIWWQPDVIYKDDYILKIPTTAKAFSAVRLHIGWYRFPNGSNIRPTLESGEKSGSFFIPVGAFVRGQARQALGANSIANGTVFGDAIKLNAYRFTLGHILELEWEVINEISGDWRVFAIVLTEPFQSNSSFVVLLQKDAAAPVPVDYLGEMETFVTLHEFDVPAGYAGEHGIYVGWYNDEIGARLAVPYQADMLKLPTVNFYRTAE